MSDAPKIEDKLKTFQTYGKPHGRVFLLSALLIAALWIGERCAWWPFLEGSPTRALFAESHGDRLVFTSYVLVLVAMWAVYFFFSSSARLKVRTLRNLLTLTSEIFGRSKLTDADNRGDLLAIALRDKARTSITMLAMLTAGATLMFTRALDLVFLAHASPWQVLIAYCSAGAAIVAAVCFIISVDSFDVMFNVFDKPDSVGRAHMLQFFYGSTRNARYYGVMFLLWSVCLFAGARSPLFGSVAIGLVVSIGWSHWFPSPPLIDDDLSPKSSWTALTSRAGFIGFPIIWPILPCMIRFFFDRVPTLLPANPPDYLFAIGSALFWAISSQVVRTALEKIPGKRKWPAIIPGLLLSFAVGSIGLFAMMRGDLVLASFSPWAMAAGVLLFPLGTGLYYLCGNAFGGRVEFASQFSNVKPAFSVGFAALFLGELLTPTSVFALILIGLGVLVLLYGAQRGTFSALSVGLGGLLAAAWGGGEALAKLGIASGPSLPATFWALSSGSAIAAIIAVPFLIAHRSDAFNGFRAWAPPFLLHGLLSFALAYALLFESISRIGVAKTALINAFWPGLAIVVSRLRQREAIPSPILLAAILLFVGSLIQILSVA